MNSEIPSGVFGVFGVFGVTGQERMQAAHARTNVRGRVPNNRLPLSLGMLRTATGLQIVPTLRGPHSRCQEISQGFFPVARTGIPNEQIRGFAYPAFT